MTQPGQIHFEGRDTAELFTKEVSESLAGLLKHNLVQTEGVFPAGFLHASPEGQLCHGQMWTRDAGTFLRELVMWGYTEEAKQVAGCMIRLVAKNQDGFHAYPESFKGDCPEAGREIDGTSAIAIGMILLWQRLPDADPMKARLHEFLHEPSSPVRFLAHDLEKGPLVRGTGEFGSGCTINEVACNVVQNAMVVLALSIAADMEQAANDSQTAQLYRARVQTLRVNMEKHLVDTEGGWIWCVNPETLKPEPQIINNPWVRGFGGINGVACMYADVFGFTPAVDPWPDIVVLQFGENMVPGDMEKFKVALETLMTGLKRSSNHPHLCDQFHPGVQSGHRQDQTAGMRRGPQPPRLCGPGGSPRGYLRSGRAPRRCRHENHCRYDLEGCTGTKMRQTARQSGVHVAPH